MPTARELLEQADALMRRNRGDTGIPVLTDSVVEAPSRPGADRRRRAREPRRADAGCRGARTAGQRATGRPQPAAPHGRGHRAARRGRRANRRRAGRMRSPPGAPRGDAELPLLTDAVDEIAVDINVLPLATADGEPSLWLGPDTIDPLPAQHYRPRPGYRRGRPAGDAARPPICNPNRRRSATIAIRP